MISFDAAIKVTGCAFFTFEKQVCDLKSIWHVYELHIENFTHHILLCIFFIYSVYVSLWLKLFMSCLSKCTENADFECVCQNYLFYFILYMGMYVLHI